MADPLNILVVCTGNICRSPAGELLLQHLLGDDARVASAGTHALAGHPVEPQMARLLPVSADGFRAQLLTPALLAPADLILAMSREHRARAVEMLPKAVRRTFTLREFARLLELPELRPEHPSPEFLREAVGLAAPLRSQVKVADPDEDDVIDPYRLDDEVFAAAYADIEAACTTIARAAGR